VLRLRDVAAAVGDIRPGIAVVAAHQEAGLERRPQMFAGESCIPSVVGGGSVPHRGFVQAPESRTKVDPGDLHPCTVDGLSPTGDHYL